MRTDRLQQEFGIKLRWSVFPLHPETPAEGMELAALFAGREAMIRDMQARLLQAAAAEGLPLTERSRTYNSRLAQELEKWAEDQGQGDQFRHAIHSLAAATAKAADWPPFELSMMSPEFPLQRFPLHHFKE